MANFKLPNWNAGDTLLERYLKVIKHDANSFDDFLREIMSPLEFKPYYPYLGNMSEFLKSVKHTLYIFDCYLLWLSKFQASWRRRHGRVI